MVFMERTDLFMTECSTISTLGNIRCFRRCWVVAKDMKFCNEGEFDKALSESLSNDTEVRLIRVHITVKITAPPLIASVQV